MDSVRWFESQKTWISMKCINFLLLFFPIDRKKKSSDQTDRNLRMAPTGRRNPSPLQLAGEAVTEADSHVHLSEPNENGEKNTRGDEEENKRDGKENRPDREKERSRFEKTGGQEERCRDP